MLHRPAQLLCILSGSYRSTPLLFRSIPNQSRRIMAHLLSGYSYPHVLYVLRYSVVKFLCKKSFAGTVCFPQKTSTVPACTPRIFWGHVSVFPYPPPLPHHTFFWVSPVRREWAYCCTACNPPWWKSPRLPPVLCIWDSHMWEPQRHSILCALQRQIPVPAPLT